MRYEIQDTRYERRTGHFFKFGFVGEFQMFVGAIHESPV